MVSRKLPVADHRIHYGAGAFQFGDLWLPARAKKAAPVAVFLHGGWWRAEYDLEYGGFLCAALRAEGLAVWSLEYRRVGNAGGGWPGTFQDAAAGWDFTETLAKSYPLDLKRVVAVGHSAGGHLAFWLAGRHHVPEGSVLYSPQPRVAMRGVVGLAGVIDLRLACDMAGYFMFAHDKSEVYRFMGGTAAQVPDRYRAGSPGYLLPLNARQVLVQGTDDGQIPPGLPGRWAELARRQGDEVRVEMVAGADHFDVVDPQSKAWGKVRAAVLGMV